MISVNEALNLVEKTVHPTEKHIRIDIKQSLNRVLAENIAAPISMPPFRQSAMDGYAVKMHESSEYSLKGEIQAGDDANPGLERGEAVRIFTGAPVPDDANAVVMQELVTVNGERLSVDGDIMMGQNIRDVGEQIEAGELAIKEGTRLSPAALGYLASLGMAEVEVYEKPRIAIIVTGNELRPPGEPLKRGEIYESNAVMLKAALQQDGFEDVEIFPVKDNLVATVEVFSKVLTDHDVLLVSGGISVGDYDFVGKALQENKVSEVFYKVKQKPGKPLYFGRKEETLVFALPGNPASALSCFYIYVLPALKKRSGYSDYHRERRLLTAANSFTKKGDRAGFLKAFVTGQKVIFLDGQASSMIQ